MIRQPKATFGKIGRAAPDDRKTLIDLDLVDDRGSVSADEHEFGQQRRHQRHLGPCFWRPIVNMAPSPILYDVRAPWPQIGEYGFETGLGLGVLMRGIIDDRIHWLTAEIAVDCRAQSFSIGLRHVKVDADRVGEFVSLQIASEMWSFGHNVESGKSLQIILMMPVDSAAAVEHANLDHALRTHALQRLVDRTDEFRILVNVNDVVGARRRSVAAAAEAQLGVPYTKDLIRQRASRIRHVSNARRQVSVRTMTIWAQLYERLKLFVAAHLVSVGAGSGYYGNILAEIVGSCGRVTAIGL
jgi:Protein-L-isoaspartate(D-aspartate) O-methyltransferase (PCMT)